MDNDTRKDQIIEEGRWIDKNRQIITQYHLLTDWLDNVVFSIYLPHVFSSSQL